MIISLFSGSAFLIFEHDKSQKIFDQINNELD